MCTGGDGPDSGGIGPDGMGANAGRGNMGNAEAGAGTIGAGARDAAAAAEGNAGPGGLGGAPGAAPGTASGSLGAGSFGGLGVGGIGALGEGTAVGEAPGSLGSMANDPFGGIAPGSTLGTTFDPNAPESMDTSIDAETAAALGQQDTDMASAMSGTTDIAGMSLGPRGTVSIDPSKGVMGQFGTFARAMSPLGTVDKAAAAIDSIGNLGNTMSGMTAQGLAGTLGRGAIGAPGTGAFGSALGQAVSHDQAVAADMAAQAAQQGMTPAEFSAAMADMQGRAVDASRAAAAMAENPGIMGHAPMSMDQSQTGMTASALGNLGFGVSRGF